MPTRSLLIVGMIAMLSACTTTTTSRMSVAELNNFQVDCKHKNQQIEFLYSQLPSRDDQVANVFVMTSITGTAITTADGSYGRRHEQYRGYNRAMIQGKIDYIRKYCP